MVIHDATTQFPNTAVSVRKMLYASMHAWMRPDMACIFETACTCMYICHCKICIACMLAGTLKRSGS